ncbi:hypothetical protein BXZ70DRAFT_533617 [Cristinia sonorae]|uniref:Transmembrane protein n=1 Tax=Cristinia sonorae TaxID=1940300 RepID=A0A8K0UIF1_9AGAR|nr:hypothetical protein BXZ70DRAFT_533617 [Cristinia sonorae]
MSATVNGRRHRMDATADTNVVVPKTTAKTVDDDATRKAILEVVQVWLDRLQLISVITTFFASIDGLLLGFMTSTARLGVINVSTWNNSTKLMNASMSGALIFHVCAAITSFIGSFVLIRYKLLDAKKHEHIVERTASNQLPSSSLSPSSHEKPRFEHSNTINVASMSHPRPRTNASFHGLSSPSLDFLPNWSEIVTILQGRVYINRVHIFDCFGRRRRSDDPERGAYKEPDTQTELEPPVKLLSRCHTLSAAMALCGFLLAILGILAFVWTELPLSISIFASACLGACFVLGVIVFTTS